MKALFIVFHGFHAFHGISKKIQYQVDALRNCGLDISVCHYDVTPEGCRCWMIDDQLLKNFGAGIKAKIYKRISFSAILEYVSRERITFVYYRSFHNANPFTIHFVKQLKKAGVTVFYEIPTYPYDQEAASFREKVRLWPDRIYRAAFCRHVDAVVTFSQDEEIFGCRTVRIANGIDFSHIPMKGHVNDITHELHLIGVAEIHFWHGFDRVLEGMGNYYRQYPAYKVYFHIVGYMSGEREKQQIMESIRRNALSDYVIMHGPQHGEALDLLFEKVDFGIGSLGRHRSGVTSMRSLKNREYAARGIPFAYSEIDVDFEQKAYVLKFPADETPIDIDKIVCFCRSSEFSPREIRNSIADLSWTEQMRMVVNEIPSSK